MVRKTASVNYAWVIVVACLAFYALPVGVVGNTAGIYATPVMEEFGWSRTEATLYMAIQQLVAAAVTPFAGMVLARFNPRWVLTGISLLIGLSTAACVFFDAPWQWNVYGVVYGFCAGFILFLAVPTIINRWFVQRSGFAIGIASAGIGVFGALASPLTQMLISAYDWQTARLVTSLTCMVLSAGLTALLLRPSPESMGVLPYGADESYGRAVPLQERVGTETVVREGATVAQALRSPGLYLLMVVAGCFSMGAFFMQQVPSACAVGPLGAEVGAFAVSAIMLGTVAGKPLLGWLADRIGAVPTGMIAGFGGALGVLIALFSGGSAPLFFLGVGIYGLGYSSLSIVSPMLGSQGFGTAHFSEIYSYVCMAISVASALGSFAFAFLYDVTGSFTVDYVLVIAIYLVSALLCPLTVKLSQRCWKGAESKGAVPCEEELGPPLS